MAIPTKKAEINFLLFLGFSRTIPDVQAHEAIFFTDKRRPPGDQKLKTVWKENMQNGP